MSYDTFESSRAKGEVISLYHFFFVNNREFFYTDAERDISKPGFSAPFLSAPVQHGSISSSGTLDKAALEIRMSRRVAIAEAFRIYPPDEVVNVIIRQMHRDDPAQEALVAWTGRIVGVGWESNEVRFTCEPISTSLRRSGLRRHYQLGCPHQLYGTQCAALKAAATTPNINAVAINGTTVRLPPNWLPLPWVTAGKTADKFVGGMLVWNITTSEGTVEMKRTILQVNGGLDVVLAGPPTGLIAGGACRLVLGCNHQMTDCKAVHNNIKNFGGQPYIPTKSPFAFANNYY